MTMYLSIVKQHLTEDQFREEYPVGLCSLADELLLGKDYTIKHSIYLYFVGDHTEPLCPAGISQFLYCSPKSSDVKNNGELIPLTMDGERFMVAKVTARIVNVGYQLLTYGAR